jgi:hypothetical protein
MALLPVWAVHQQAVLGALTRLLRQMARQPFGLRSPS